MTWLNKPIIFNIVTAVTVILAVLLRFLAIHMYDIQIDELIYQHFAQAIASGYLPLNYYDIPFFLHPPGYYVALSVWRTIFWHGSDIFAQLTVLRSFNIILSGFTALIIILLTRIVTKKNNLAIITGVLFALDPFAIRLNTRGLMETMAMLLLLIGLWSLFRNTNNPESGRKTWLLTGLLFGLAIVTKDVAAIFLFFAFVIMTLRKVGPDLKVLFRYIIPTAILPYVIWISIVASTGHIGELLSEKTLGVRRFFGLVQVTGFNSSSAPSKSDTLLSTLPHYASSYIIMGLSILGMLLLLKSKDKNRRMWGCIAAASILAIGYLIIGGTFEEQYLYYLLVPSLFTIVVATLELEQIIPSTYRFFVRIGGKLGIAILFLFGLTTYIINMSSADNGWQKTIEWVNANVPPNSTICVYAQGQLILGEEDYNVCSWHSLSDINAHHVQYIIDPEKLTQSNYVPLTDKDIADIKPESKVVFSYNSRDSGKFLIFELPRFANAPGPSHNKK